MLKLLKFSATVYDKEHEAGNESSEFIPDSPYLHSTMAFSSVHTSLSRHVSVVCGRDVGALQGSREEGQRSLKRFTHHSSTVWEDFIQKSVKPEMKVPSPCLMEPLTPETN